MNRTLPFQETAITTTINVYIVKQLYHKEDQKQQQQCTDKLFVQKTHNSLSTCLSHTVKDFK